MKDSIQKSNGIHRCVIDKIFSFYVADINRQLRYLLNMECRFFIPLKILSATSCRLNDTSFLFMA